MDFMVTDHGRYVTQPLDVIKTRSVICFSTSATELELTFG